MKDSSVSSRRDFLKTSGAAAAVGFAAPFVLSTSGRAAAISPGETIKVGLVGCGGRGSGAANQALGADPNVVLTAVGDAFEDALQRGLKSLQKVNGDLSRGQKRFQATLAKLSFESPTGKVSLDENSQAITDVFITEVAHDKDGKLYNKIVKVVPQVRQTLGMPREAFLKLGKAGRDNPECP